MDLMIKYLKNNNEINIKWINNDKNLLKLHMSHTTIKST
jgi:hypothetical protein